MVLVLLPGLSRVDGATGSVLTIKGSNTIGGSLGPAWAERFMREHPEVDVRIEALGSSTGFAGLFDGSAAIAAASRAINDSELEQARRLGLSVHEYVVGYDGIAVIVHPDNPVRRLTVPQLALIFSGAIDRWSDVRGADLAIVRLSRPSYSGTHGFFKEAVVQGPLADDTEWIEANEEILRRVAAEPGAISYVGFGWVDDRVRALAVAVLDERQAIAPEQTTLHDGSYPIYRPLLLYTATEPTGPARDLLDFVYSPEGRQLVASHGFVPADLAPSLAPAPSGPDPSAPVPDDLVRVRFASSSTDLRHDDRRDLMRLVRAVLDGHGRLVITGHADSLGDPDANRRVSLARARAVASFVVAAGVPVDLISVEGIGSDRPIASNETPQGRWLNRRVDVHLVRGGR
jgi:phosphate binding protein